MILRFDKHTSLIRDEFTVGGKIVCAWDGKVRTVGRKKKLYRYGLHRFGTFKIVWDKHLFCGRKCRRAMMESGS